MSIRTKRVLVDFDGVLATRRQQRGQLQKPILNAVSSVNALKDRGYEIYVFSTRATNGRRYISDWLKKHNIKHDLITNVKFDADYYIDDKAIKFDGDWSKTLDAIS